MQVERIILQLWWLELIDFYVICVGKLFISEIGTSPNRRKKNFVFKTSNTPPADKGLDGFENDLWEIIRNIEFNHKGRNPFQNMLKERLKLDKECKDI